MLELKEAVQRAKDFVRDIYGPDAKDVRLEEVNRSDDGIWLITIGFRDLFASEIPSLPQSILSQWDILRGPTAFPRVYKVLRVDPQTGSVAAMLNRVA